MKTVLRTIIVIILLGLAGIYSGVFNVAADKPDSRIFAWILETTRERSIETRADRETIPADLASFSIEEGFRDYHAVCEKCHGGPEMKPTKLQKGLNPAPPDLHKQADTISAVEAFWVVKHGIKMSGMASFGKSYSDKELLAIVAFVKKLPNISEAEYGNLLKKESKSRGKPSPQKGAGSAKKQL